MGAVSMSKILLVDDSNFQRNSLAKKLQELACEVDQAPNGDAGLTLARSKKFDLIITDLHMPVMDGFDFIKSIRKLDQTVPIFVLSADVQSGTHQEIKAAGGNGFLPKPLSKDVLEELIKGLFS